MSGIIGTSHSKSKVIGRSQDTASAWVNFDGTGTVAIRDSFNVSSVTDNGTGDYTVTFTTAMANANYAPVFYGNAHSSEGHTSFGNQYAGGLGDLSTTTFGIMTYNAAAIDSANVFAVVFGD